MRKFIKSGLTFLAAAGIFCICLAATLTAADVVLRNTIGSPIKGLVDLTQLAMMYAVFMSIAFGFANHSHVAVTVLTDHLSPRFNAVLSAFWWLAAVCVLSVLSYATFKQAAAIMSYGDVSQNIKAPMIMYWAPVVAGQVLSALGALVATLDELDILYRGKEV